MHPHLHASLLAKCSIKTHQIRILTLFRRFRRGTWLQEDQLIENFCWLRNKYKFCVFPRESLVMLIYINIPPRPSARVTALKMCYFIKLIYDCNHTFSQFDTMCSCLQDQFQDTIQSCHGLYNFTDCGRDQIAKIHHIRELCHQCRDSRPPV